MPPLPSWNSDREFEPVASIECRGGDTVKLINAKLLSTAVIPLAAAAGLAIGGGIMTAAPSHARGVSQDVAAELPRPRRAPMACGSRVAAPARRKVPAPRVAPRAPARRVAPRARAERRTPAAPKRNDLVRRRRPPGRRFARGTRPDIRIAGEPWSCSTAVSPAHTGGDGSGNVQFCAEGHAAVAEDADSLFFLPEEFRARF